jgi:hypothetical protein
MSQRAASPSAPIGDALQNRPYMAALGFMVAGYYSVEFITNNVIPLTARHFTDSPFFIAAVVALNRLFGFIVQPYVSWKSDAFRAPAVLPADRHSRNTGDVAPGRRLPAPRTARILPPRDGARPVLRGEHRAAGVR